MFSPSGPKSEQELIGSFATPTGSPSRELPVTETEDEEEGQSLRLSALEFMLSLCEARPSMFKKSSYLSVSSSYLPQQSVCPYRLFTNVAHRRQCWSRVDSCYGTCLPGRNGRVG